MAATKAHDEETQFSISSNQSSVSNSYKADISSQSIAQVRRILELNKPIQSEPVMHHHDHRREIISGSITNKSNHEVIVNIEVDENKSDDRHTPPLADNGNYTKRFVVITNSVTAITTALIGAGVAILIHFKGCS